MTRVAEKAARAERLRASEDFKEFHQGVLDEQTAVFANPSAKPEEISEAHAMIRALSKLSDQMSRAVMAQKVERKRAAKKP